MTTHLNSLSPIRPIRPIRRMGLPLSILLSVLMGLALSAGFVSAEDWGYDLGGELMSPFCPGRTLASCPSPQAAELVQWIVTQEAAGATKEEVLEILVEKWGEEILGAPPAKGITLWAYIFPVLGFVLLGGVAFIVLRNISERGPAAVSASGGGSVVTDPVTASDSSPESTIADSSGHLGDSSSAGRSETDEELAALVDAEIARRA